MNKIFYIFDFDETLIFNDGKIYVVNDNTSTRLSLSYKEYYSYRLKPNEYFDASDYDQIKNPRINNTIFDILLKNVNNCCVLTARKDAAPIKEYLLSLNIGNVPVFAIGSKNPTKNHLMINATRKKDWIKQVILKYQYKHVVFYDDNPMNINKVNELNKELTDVRIESIHVDTW